jgi:hypothetical protein
MVRLNIEYIGHRRDGFIGILTLSDRRYAVGIEFDEQDAEQSVKAKINMIANSASLTYHLQMKRI